MERLNIIILCLLIGSIFLISVNAGEFPDYTDKYVNDFAGILSSNQINELRTLFSNIDSTTTAEVVFVSIETSEPYVPAEYRTKLFNYWHVGKKDKDNGLLILYSVKEHRIEVEVGYGLEGVLPDSMVGRYLDDYYVPMRDSGNVSQGIVSFSQEITKIIEENKDEVISGQSSNPQINKNALPFILGIVFFPAVIFIFIFVVIIISIVYAVKKINKVDDEQKFEKIKLGEIKEIPTGWTRFFYIIGFFLIVILLFFVLPAIIPTIIYVPLFFLSVLFIIIISIVTSVKSMFPKCNVCKEKMSFVKYKGGYNIYKCPNGHLGKIKVPRSSGVHYGGYGGGFGGGGGFSGGGGGFGGGGSGGGGAGR